MTNFLIFSPCLLRAKVFVCQERLERLSQRRAGPSQGYSLTRARRLSRDRPTLPQVLTINNREERREAKDSTDSLYGSSAGDINHQHKQQSLRVWVGGEEQSSEGRRGRYLNELMI